MSAYYTIGIKADRSLIYIVWTEKQFCSQQGLFLNQI